MTSTLHGFETEMLASGENLLGLMAVNRELVAQAEASRRFRPRGARHGLHTESPVHGQQEGSAYYGHFESLCYHPLLLFNQPTATA